VQPHLAPEGITTHIRIATESLGFPAISGAPKPTGEFLMHYTIERLLTGDTTVPTHFELARDKWNELFEGKFDATVSDWARWLTDQQIMFFEHRCGGRWEGQEVMAWSGFGSLYSIKLGFTEDTRKLAIKLAKAFAQSSCSIEVKGAARRAALSYHLDDEPELKDVLRHM
jgi:hypothetical protein